MLRSYSFQYIFTTTLAILWYIHTDLIALFLWILSLKCPLNSFSPWLSASSVVTVFQGWRDGVWCWIVACWSQSRFHHPIATHRWEEPDLIRLPPTSLQIFITIYQIPPSVVFSPGWTDPGYSAFLHQGGAPGPLSSLWHSAGLLPGDPWCLWTKELRTGHRLLAALTNIKSP